MIEINSASIRTRLVSGWRTPVAFAFAAAILAIVMLAFSSPTYEVHMTIMPAPTPQNLSMSGTGGALSTVLGIGGGGGAGSDYTRYQRILYSPVVAQRLQTKYGMLQQVFRGNWDAKNQRWIERRSLRSYLFGWLFAIAHVPSWSPPDIEALAAYLKSIQMVPSLQTDIIGMTMTSSDPKFAARVLLLADHEANGVLRDQAATRSKQKVAYLRQKIDQTSVQDYRQTLLALLSVEEKTLMLTETSDAYAAEVVSPPSVSSTPISPRPVLSLFVGLLVGTLIGMTVVIFFGADWWKAVLSHLPSFGNRNPYAGTSHDGAAQ